VKSLYLTLFGRMEIRDGDGRKIRIAESKAALLLAFLALQAGRSLSRERLIGLLWSDRGEAQARGSLRHAIWALRRALGGIEPPPLIVEDDELALDPACFEADTFRFEALLTEGSPTALEAAIGLYRGAFLEGVRIRDPAFQTLVRGERQRLQERAVDACLRLLQHHSENGAEKEAALTAKRMLEIDPLQEVGHRALMAHQAAKGQLGLAIKQYQSCRDALRQELDVVPDAETERLLARIRLESSNGSYEGGESNTGEREAPPPREKPSIAVLPLGRPGVRDLSHVEQEYRERLKARYAEDTAYYVSLTGRTTEAEPNRSTPAPRSARRRRHRAECEYHEWLAVGENIRQVKLDSLSEAVERYPCIILLGEPGCGKTMAVEALAHEYADQENRLPLSLPLGGFTGGTSVTDFIVRCWGGPQEAGYWGAPELAGSLWDFLETGALFILFDGLNEIPLHGYGERCAALREFIDHWSARGNRFLVTCRILDYGEELSGLQRVEVQALSDAQIQLFLRNEVPHRWHALWQRLQQGDGSHRLLEMARNPYLLTIIIDVFEEDGDLGRNRAVLMRRVTQIMIDWARTHCPADQWLDADLLCEALSLMAFEMQRRSGFGTWVKTDQIKAILPDRLQPDPNWPAKPIIAEQVLSLAAGANIVEMPVDRRTVRFYHQMLQEYFAAYRMLQHDTAELADLWRGPWLETEMKAWTRPDNNYEPLPPPPPTGWEETTIFAYELVPAGDDWLIRALLLINPVLAGRCLAQDPGGADPGLRQTAVERLLAAVADPEVALRVRIAAGNVLGLLGDPRSGGMVIVPAGAFVMGDGREQHELYLPEYRIGRYPVTNMEFQRFVDAGGYRDQRWWTEAGWLEVGRNQDMSRYWRDARFNKPNQPVIGLSWYECVAYCRWLSAETGHTYRLPTEAEWEKGARGDDGRTFPWGNDHDPDRLNGRGENDRDVCATTPVGIYPDGASPYGLFDCVGNGWEWCATRWKKPFPYDVAQDEWQDDYLLGQHLRVLRGGSWYNKAKVTCCTHRFKFQPYGWNDRGGCRLVSPG